MNEQDMGAPQADGLVGLRPEPASGLGHSATIPSAAWKDQEGPLLITTNTIAGEIASWAVQQSPYGCPEGLERAIGDFRAAWPSDPEMAKVLPMQWWTSYGDLYSALYELFCRTPSIAAWNEPKSGHTAQVVFSDRYSGPAPDDDFIDLGALANNVARECWKDALADRAFDDDFAARHAASAMSAREGRDAGERLGAEPASAVRDSADAHPSSEDQQ